MRLRRKQIRKGRVTSRMCLGVRDAHGLKLAMTDLLVIRSKPSRSLPRRKVRHSHLSRRPRHAGHSHT
jgi:hypothetical protein